VQQEVIQLCEVLDAMKEAVLYSDRGYLFVMLPIGSNCLCLPYRITFKKATLACSIPASGRMPRRMLLVMVCYYFILSILKQAFILEAGMISSYFTY